MPIVKRNLPTTTKTSSRNRKNRQLEKLGHMFLSGRNKDQKNHGLNSLGAATRKRIP
jgi:hypothetical protein